MASRRWISVRSVASAAAGIVGLALLASGLWPTAAVANAAHEAAGAAATQEANKCGAQFKGAQLYDCLGGVVDRLATRIDRQGRVGTELARELRPAAATVRQANKQAAVAALSQVRNTIAGFISRFKGQGQDETPGMNALRSAISTTIRWIQTKG
ncbi:MAG TPA: hypothetical protein VGF29_01945 [Hyphomicrobiaceae bacterium]|jgi:hypothetical protein